MDSVDQIMRDISAGSGPWLMDNHTGAAWSDFARGVKKGFNGALLSNPPAWMTASEHLQEKRTAVDQIEIFIPSLRGALTLYLRA